MNKFIILILSLIFCCSCKNTGNQVNTISLHNSIKTTVPEALITEEKFSWQQSPVIAGKSFNDDGSTKITTATFEKNGTFKFYYDEIEITGTVEFSKNSAGKNILITHATNGIIKTKPDQLHKINTRELASKYSNTYLWEKISFPGVPSEDFLLLVDLDTHPQATAKPGSIDKSWVSKFHIALKN